MRNTHLAGRFSHTYNTEPLGYLYFTHQTPLIRKLKDADMWMQQNKKVNLKIAASSVDGITIAPGEVFSYWRLFGRPTCRKGYLPGMILRNGEIVSGIGGGLCQLSNLIFWMAIHTPLTVIERHRHGYDVFPDSDRTQPFGSGATCFYPHGDLMIRNDTPNTYQIKVWLNQTHLYGEIHCDVPATVHYRIVERNHRILSTWWGGYLRHNELYQQTIDIDGRILKEHRIVENDAIMMYSPLIKSEEGNGL